MADPQDLECEQITALHELVADVAPDVNIGLSQKIAELLHQGIEVYADNNPSPKNAQPCASATQTIS